MEQGPDSGPPNASVHRHFSNTHDPLPALDIATNVQDRSHPDPLLLQPDFNFTEVSSHSEHTTTLHNHPTAEPPATSALAPYPPTAGLASALSQDAISATPIDPDDFYKSYRSTVAISSSAAILSAADAATAVSAPVTEPAMSSTLSSQQPILSNGNDGAYMASHATALAVPPSRGPNLQHGTRSVSGPIVRSKGGPSVKDLKKRFDEKGTASHLSSTVPSRPIQSNSRQRRGHTESSVSPNHGVAPLPSHDRLSPKGHGHLEGGPGEMVSMPQVLSSQQSFANRIHNTSTTAASSSLHQLSRRPHDQQRRGKSAGLLFGEVAPDHGDSAGAGFGIDEIRPRRTSESSIHTKSTFHSLSNVDDDLESSSVPSSYTSAATHPAPASESPISGHQSPRTRSQSDASSHGSSNRTPIALRTGSRNLNTPQSTSKLPVAVRRLHSPTGSSGTPSPSRGTSPASLRLPPSSSGQMSRLTPPSSRAKTPTSLNKTPTPAVRERRPPPPSLNNSASSSGRMRAQSITSPKLSPALRSSRPRQPLANASNVVPKKREPGTAKSSRSRGKESAPRRRKISAGPIDFEQRREHIRLAYSKSIRESRALEATQKTTLQSGEAGTAAAQPTLNGEQSTDIPPVPQIPRDAIDQVFNRADESKSETLTTTGPLVVSAKAANSAVEAGQDSPTLGIPGSFPPSSPPLNTVNNRASIVSVASQTTEFDGEAQTAPPVPAQQWQDTAAAVVQSPTLNESLAVHTKAEYMYPFSQDRDDINQPTEDHTQLTVQHNTKHLPPASLSVQDSSPLMNAQSQTRQHGHAAVFPVSEIGYESDCQSETDDGHDIHRAIYPHSEAATTDACTEDTDDRDRDDRVSEFRYDDQLDSKRASTCASSDVSAFDDLQYASDRGSYPVSSNLGIPSSRFRPDRASHQSAWTDLSVESSGQLDTAAFDIFGSNRNSASHSGLFAATISPRQELFPGAVLSPVEKQLPPTPDNPQLPEVDTGEGFSIPYLSPEPRDSSPKLPSPPAHEPPPIPKSVSGSAMHSRNSSVAYEPSQSASTLINSERNSDLYMRYAHTPRSVDATSFDTADNDSSSKVAGSTDSDGKSLRQNGDVPSEKERHRLVQRRNIIKELLDTEAVFVRDMNIVEEIYKGTAEACPRLDDQTVKLIFRNSHEIVEFHTAFLAEIKTAVAPVYVPKVGRTVKALQPPGSVEPGSSKSLEISDGNDRETSVGPVFQRHLERMKTVHDGFLRNSDQAAKRLIQIQQDSAVQVWLSECNEVAKDLTAAWDLDSLLIKPMQRITKYPNLIVTLLHQTPQDHPDREPLLAAKDTLETAILEINKAKKNFELVGQIVGRKHKESDVKAGFARAFGKRVDKLQSSSSKVPDDPIYTKLNEKFGDDFVQLQVVLRDVEFYTRQVSQYVHEFLQYLSSIELVMRLQPGSFPEIESKWVQFNISMRDLEKIALEDHIAQVRKQVIEPFEQVIKAYGNPSLAMKKRQKRRLDYERADQQRRSGKSLDPKLRELVDQYDALNDALKTELPKLSVLTEKVGKICLSNFVNIQADWYKMWTEKMRTVLLECPDIPDLDEIVATFHRDYPYAADQLAAIGILNPDSNFRSSHSAEYKTRYSETERRGRGSSVNDELSPALPTPDFTKRSSAGMNMSPSTSSSASNVAVVTNPHQYYYRDYYAGIQTQGTSSASPKSADLPGSSRSVTGTGHTSTRPSTGKSFDSGVLQRQSSDMAAVQRSDSNVTYTSSHTPNEGARYSNLFHSALPLPDGTEDSQRSSRASSRERGRGSDGYNILWLAASLFEFNIETTKHEAGYPYLTYQAGEIFDIIAEKGELWLAKNQDDPTEMVGWIWSKHFAKLADS